MVSVVKIATAGSLFGFCGDDEGVASWETNENYLNSF
jgi:hypothetical protein